MSRTAATRGRADQQHDFLRAIDALPELDALRCRPGRRPTLAEARRVLQIVWGYPDFRPAQARALAAVLEGNDVLAVFPTGGGKSLCYQVPAMLLAGVTIVVSPLISLMKDQIDALRGRGVPARYLNSSLRPDEVAEVYAALSRDELRLLYVSPERFDSPEFTRQIGSARVALLAIDEAHCVSEWGHDFRPAYKRLGAGRTLFPDAPVVAVTATATPRVRRDIVDQLALRAPSVQVGGFDRPNLHWAVISTPDPTAKLAAMLRALRGLRGSAIVYVSTQDGARDVAQSLCNAGHPAEAYHAGLSPARRKAVQDSFMAGRTRIVVATNAFGMGIDKPDIRLVLHYTMPATMEALYQEAGRGGRDGQLAKALLLYAPGDRATHEHLIEQAHPTRGFVESVFRTLRAVSDAGGHHPDPTAAVKKALNLSSTRPVHAALKVLADAGVVSYTTARRLALHVTLLQPAERVRDILRDRSRGDDLQLMRRLWQLMDGEALYRGATLRAAGLEALPGARDEVRAGLARLASDGILSWTMEELGTRLLGTTAADSALPIDWGRLDAVRRLEIAKLDAVQAYATRKRCRRQALLDYFHDNSPVTCTGCDHCDRSRRNR